MRTNLIIFLAKEVFVLDVNPSAVSIHPEIILSIYVK
jgi:hypothetical protein